MRIPDARSRYTVAPENALQIQIARLAAENHRLNCIIAQQDAELAQYEQIICAQKPVSDEEIYETEPSELEELEMLMDDLNLMTAPARRIVEQRYWEVRGNV